MTQETDHANTELTARSVEHYLTQVERTHQDTKSDRDMLRGKLRDYLKDLELKDVHPKGMEGTLMALDIFNKLLKDADGQAETLTKLHLANKKADQIDNAAGVVAACLKHLHGVSAGIPINEQTEETHKHYESVDDDLERAFSERCVPLKPQEMT